MPRDDCGFVRKREKPIVDRGDELAGVASGKVGAAYGAGEEGIPGEEEGLLGEVEADAALGVAGSVEDASGEAGDGDDLVVVEGVVGGWDFRGRDAEPGGLDVHHFDQREVELVVEDGCSGELLEALGSGDVVDVGVGDDDLLDSEAVPLERGDDVGDVVAGVDDDGLAGGFVAEDGAVAAERAYDEDFVDHGLDLRVMTGMKNAQADGLRIGRSGSYLVFAGALWVVEWPERTEWSPPKAPRERMTVRPMDVSIKTIAA